MRGAGGPSTAYRNRGSADYGDWTQIVRELSDNDYDRAQKVKRWPVREALVALAARMKADALEAYRFEMVVWSALAPYLKKSDPPKLPAILKE